MTEYQQILASLEGAFTSQEAAKIPREDRVKVTAALEETLERLIALFKPDLFLEVGAFEAEFSCRMKAIYPGVRAIALEANPRVHASFAAQVARAGVEYLHLAADARSGEAKFFIPEVVAGHPKPTVSRMGSLNEIGLHSSEMTEVRVRAVALDEIIAPIAPERVCMWIDVEGAANKVLRGAAGTLAKTVLVYCEVESRPIWKDAATVAEVVEIMDAAGFFVAARDFQTNVQFNLLFLRKESAGPIPIRALVQDYAERAIGITSALIAARQDRPPPPKTAEPADVFADGARALLAASAPAFDMKTLAARGRAEGLLSIAEAENIALYNNFPDWLRTRLMQGAARPEQTIASLQLLPAQSCDLAPPRGDRPEGSILAGLQRVQLTSPPVMRIDGGASIHHVANFRRISWTSDGVIANMSDPRGQLFLPYLEACAPVPLKGRSFLAVVEGASVYTHWMLDTLPRLLFVREAEGSLDAYDHFIFATARTNFQKATLEALGIDLSRVVSREQAGVLFATESFTYVTESRHGHAAHDRVYDAVARLFLGDVSPQTKSRRLYISRSKATRRRVLNEDALLPVLERHGFEALSLEDMSVREAAVAFREASHVLAAHGAGLTNLVFARPGTRIMEIHGAHLSRDYWVMANQRQLPYFGFEALGPDGARLTEEARRRLAFFERNFLDMIVPLDRFVPFLEKEFLARS